MRILFTYKGQFEEVFYNNLDEGYDFLAEAVCMDEITIFSVTDRYGYPLDWKKIIYAPWKEF